MKRVENVQEFSSLSEVFIRKELDGDDWESMIMSIAGVNIPICTEKSLMLLNYIFCEDIVKFDDIILIRMQAISAEEWLDIKGMSSIFIELQHVRGFDLVIEMFNDLEKNTTTVTSFITTKEGENLNQWFLNYFLYNYEDSLFLTEQWFYPTENNSQ